MDEVGVCPPYPSSCDNQSAQAEPMNGTERMIPHIPSLQSMERQNSQGERSTFEAGVESPSPLRIHTSSESRDKFTTMKANDAARETPHTKKSSRASIELDMVLKTENSFQTVDDNCDAVKRQMLPSSIATPETESSSISYERPRRRKIKSKNKRQSSRLMLCGALGDEDDTIIHDAKTSLRQIVSTLKAFGPDEKEAVREVLLEGASSIKGTLKKFAGQCGKRTP